MKLILHLLHGCLISSIIFIGYTKIIDPTSCFLIGLFGMLILAIFPTVIHITRLKMRVFKKIFFMRIVKSAHSFLYGTVGGVLMKLMCYRVWGHPTLEEAMSFFVVAAMIFLGSAFNDSWDEYKEELEKV